jgi:hypothetical protein
MTARAHEAPAHEVRTAIQLTIIAPAPRGVVATLSLIVFLGCPKSLPGIDGFDGTGS